MVKMKLYTRPRSGKAPSRDERTNVILPIRLSMKHRYVQPMHKHKTMSHHFPIALKLHVWCWCAACTGVNEHAQ